MPAVGAGHYLRDLVYGALDGAITTLAVVAGTAGADLSPRTGMILGLANLVADGFSMGASNYLALKSELEQTSRSVADEAPWRHGLATVGAFVVVGTLPLAGYAVVLLHVPGVSRLLLGWPRWRWCSPARRARPSCGGPLREAPSTSTVGAVAGAAAYAVGALASRAVGA